MPEVTLPDGRHLHYLDPHPEGGEPVLLIHGLGATGLSWLPQFAALQAAGFRPLAPDVPGFGGSPHRGRWRVEGAAEALVGLLDALDLPQAHVVGVSMGGVLAQRIAVAHPQRVKRLVLVVTFAHLAPAGWLTWLYFAWRFALVMALGPARQAQAVARRLFPAPEQAVWREAFVEQVRQADPRAYRQAMLALGRFDGRPALARIQAPTLVVIGEADEIVPPPLQAELAQGIPGALVWRLPGHGHALTVTAAEAFNARLVAFLRAG